MLDKFYEDKVILAPMVRVGTLPGRLLSLRYGADIVYTEEIIDFRILRSQRVMNNELRTIDYVDKSDESIIFRTCDEEKGKVVFQLGTSDSSRAAAVARLVQNDVAGIDINMGCPKEFSLKGGMGAALLSKPDIACDILKSVKNASTVPVTCKIRVLPSVEETIDLCEKFEKSGISAIAIHGRTIKERPKDANRIEIIKAVAERLTIPVIASGGCNHMKSYEDIQKFKKLCSCSSVMIARTAKENFSIFRRDGLLPIDQVIREYLKLAIAYDSCFVNVKYCVQNMIGDNQRSEMGRKFLATENIRQLCDIWKLGDYLQDEQSKRLNNKNISTRNCKKRKLDDGECEENNIETIECCFVRSHYKDTLELPKTKINVLAYEMKIAKPKYETKQINKFFVSVLTFNNCKYSSSYWEKNKRSAEQSAALACLCSLGIYDSNMLKNIGALLK